MESKKIQCIQFGLLSPEEIAGMAVCEIKNNFDKKDIQLDEIINDLRMGPINNLSICKTCNQNYENCPGHFGYIKLNKPVFHIEFISECVKILNCICYNCHRILIDDYDKYEEYLSIINPEERILKTFNHCIEIDKCRERRNQKGKNVEIYYKPGCGYKKPIFKQQDLKIIMEYEENSIKKEKIIQPEEILNIFKDISDIDCILLGFHPKYSRPDWMIIQNLIVCPPKVNPPIYYELFNLKDDLTLLYKNIISINDKLIKNKNNPKKNQNIFDELQLHVASLINNTYIKNNTSIKSLIERLNGKEGIIRSNLLGKNVNFCARSVISPEPNLQLDEVGIPISIAMNVTFPEQVNNLNINKLKNLIKNGSNKYPGANTIIKNDGRIIELKYINNIKYNDLNIGDIVERHLQDGDYVILEHQPLLQKSSIMGHRVRIFPYSTFGINLAVTTPYNVQFNENEMNIHVPQSLESKSDIINIMNVSNQIISPKNNRSIMNLLEDALIGCKLFTEKNNLLTYEEVCDLLIWIDDFDINNIPMPCILKPKPLWSGKQIFSLLLPKKLNIENSQDFNDNLNLEDNFVQIKNGELIQGIINKQIINNVNGGIVQNIWINESPKKAMDFLYNCQKIMNNYLLIKGFTVGISDIILDKTTEEKICDELYEIKNKVNNILNYAMIGNFMISPNFNNIFDAFEYKVNEEYMVHNFRTQSIIYRSIDIKNHLKNMVLSGSKGNQSNLLQILGFVGQQSIEGKRIPFKFNKRTLPHYLKDDYKTESKGFIQNSFSKGLTPQEFFFNLMSGREGIIETVTKESELLKIQNYLMRSLEDIMIKYDNTVRDSSGNIIQFLYGEDGMAGEYIENQFFETHKMDNYELKKNYKFIENDDEDEDTFYNDFRLFMEDNVIDELLNSTDFSLLKYIFNKEFEQIKNDRDEVRNNILTGNNNNIYIPVDINKIINIAKNEYKINNYAKSDLNPLYVIAKLKELKESLKLIKGDDIISKQKQECSMNLFNKVLNYSLSTKNIIFKHRLSKKAFDLVCNEIKTKFEQAIVKPGEMVGALAAQCIGESASHLVNYNVLLFKSIIFNLSLESLTDIIKVKKELKAPYMNIYIKEKGNNAMNTIFKVKDEIECLKPDKLINLSEIYYDPDITHSIIEEDQEIIDEYYEIMFGNGINEIIPYISPWVLRFELNRYIYREHYFTIEKKIKKYLTKGNIIFIQSPAYLDKKIILIRLMADSSMNENEKKEILSLKYLKSLEKKIINSESLSGIENIKKVYLENKFITKYDNLGRLILNDGETILKTEGSDLSKVFELEEIDFKRTITNNVHEIYNILGIEAARKIILNELKEIFKSYGIYINHRHFSILCDYMTHKGYLTPISKKGLNKADFSPIRTTTVNKNVESLIKAGRFALNDKLKGISENILVGNLTNIGTGCFDLLLDINN